VSVASLELCKELYKLSKWESDYWYDWNHGEPTVEDMKLSESNIPAYDLGYLLRKLRYANTKAYIEADKRLEQMMMSEYPEDYAASWLIELFKQGLLE
jgi:hypothetical protein